MKWVKRILIAFLFIVILAVIGLGIFMYKAQHGFASYETKIPNIDIPSDKPSILLFSKTTAFRHGAAIEATKTLMDSLAMANDWFLYETEEGGIFNSEQLKQFEVVIWSNSTGPVLNPDQRKAFESYIKGGGGFLGIHGTGDFSHKWPWFTDELISADFSHHPIKNHIQSATVYLSEDVDSIWQIPPVWTQHDEWYIFLNSPADKGATLLYWIDGDLIDPNGNLLWMKDKDFGMGKIHPVAWYKEVGLGRSFYTSMGHTAATFQNKNFIATLIKAIDWTGKLE